LLVLAASVLFLASVILSFLCMPYLYRLSCCAVYNYLFNKFM
jgi:hypothetical protein